MKAQYWTTAILLITSISASQTAFAACQDVERVARTKSEHIKQKLNRSFPSAKKTIGIGEKVQMRKAEHITFQGCNAALKVQINVDRAWSKNAKGSLTLVAKVDSVDSKKICISNMKLQRIDLNNTTALKMSFYRGVANTVMPTKKKCFKI